MHFNRLVADGMLTAEAGVRDRRTKIVRLTSPGEKLLMRAALTLQQACAPVTPARVRKTKQLAKR